VPEVLDWTVPPPAVTIRRVRSRVVALLAVIACGGSTARGSGSQDGAAQDDGGPSCGTLGDACCSDGTCAAPLTCAGGVCGCVQSSDCPGGGSCITGRCLITLASGLSGPYPIAVDSNSVYWANQGYKAPQDSVGNPNLIMKVGRDGGSPVTLATFRESSGYGANGFAVGADGVYWTNGAELLQVPLAGGPVTTLFAAAGTNGLYQIAVDATNVYFIVLSPAVSVLSMPLAGGMATTLSSQTGGNVSGLAVDSTNVYWSTVYNNFEAPGTISSLPRAGGTPTTLLTLAPWGMPYLLGVGATSAYWTDGQSLSALPLGGGSSDVLLADAGVYIEGFTTYSTTLYWADENDNTLVTLPGAGGSPAATVVADKPYAVAVDSTSIYWTSPSAGTVMRLSPR
jgi:hypothetical protein